MFSLPGKLYRLSSFGLPRKRRFEVQQSRVCHGNMLIIKPHKRQYSAIDGESFHHSPPHTPPALLSRFDGVVFHLKCDMSTKTPSKKVMSVLDSIYWKEKARQRIHFYFILKCTLLFIVHDKLEQINFSQPWVLSIVLLLSQKG